MKKTLFTATLLAASLMAASTVQAAPQEVTMWHYFDQKPEQEMLADMVEEYNSLQDDIHINATFVSRTELRTSTQLEHFQENFLISDR